MKIILIGYMGSGKTTVGKQLAQSLHLPFKDLDMELESLEESSISDIFSERGEIYFRKKEGEILKKLLQNEEDFVLSTGGGTPCYGNAIDEMLAAPYTTVVFLKTPISALSNRLFLQRSTRPLIAHLDSEEALSEFIGIHLFERSTYYVKAHLIIDTAGKSIAQVSEEILQNISLK